MALPRVQAFEFNDQPWVPAVLRDTIVEALSRTLVWGRMLDGLVDPLAGFLERAGTHEVLDLGSGAGGPAEIVLGAFERRGLPLSITLTDLFPRPEVWRPLAERHHGSLHFVEESVDATRIPEELSRGRARTIINVLHHLPESLARGVIESAIEDRAPIFVAEGFERNPLTFAAFAPVGIPALALSPILSRDRRLARAVLTWATPIAILASTWDGIVSTLRVYTEDELLDMARRDPTYEWSYGLYRYKPFGHGYYFCGIPR